MDIAMKMVGSEGGMHKFIEQTIYLWAESLIFASVSAVQGNVAVRLAWGMHGWLQGKKIDGQKQTRH